MDAVVQDIDELVVRMTEFRHDIHMHPEPGFKEFRTAKKIREQLNCLGEPKSYAGTGMVFRLTGEGPEAPVPRVISIRADMDALTMTEGNKDLPWRSVNEGVAHMCGHDSHMAMAVGAALALHGMKTELPSNCSVEFLFQPAEEGPGGAEPMLKEGCLEGVDEVYGVHNWPIFPLGTVAVKSGPFMANVITFDIEITGKGGHASACHLVNDPIICGSSVVIALQTIMSRNKNPLEPAVLSVSTFHAGERHNVIPNVALLTGTARNVNKDVAQLIRKRIDDTLKSMCELHNCTYKLGFESSASYPPVINHPTETEHVIEVANSLGLSVTDENLPSMAAEDFSYFLEEKPGCFFFLGCESPGMCHSTNYEADDRIIPIGIKFWIQLVKHRFQIL